MIYDLPLTIPGWAYPEIDFEQNKIHKQNLESLTSLEKKLNYYNSNICSLSVYSMQEQIYFEWGNPDQVIKIFCNCSNCRKLPDFNFNDEKIYFRLRDKEVKRIVKAIDSKATYKDKLDFIFNTKGYNPDHTINIYSNITFDPSKNIDREMYLKKPVSLIPTTKDQKGIYNEFGKAAFDNDYKNGKEFSEYYNGFDFEKEKARLNISIQKPDADVTTFLQLLKNQIERHFNYPACNEIGEKENQKHIIKQINKNLIENYGHIPFMFSKMAMGISIDFNKNVLNTRTFLELAHTEQVVKFYNYVKDLIERKGQLASSPNQLEQKKEQKDIIETIIERTWKIH